MGIPSGHPKLAHSVQMCLLLLAEDFLLNKNWNVKMNLNISQAQICFNSQSPIAA